MKLSTTFSYKDNLMVTLKINLVPIIKDVQQCTVPRSLHPSKPQAMVGIKSRVKCEL